MSKENQTCQGTDCPGAEKSRAQDLLCKPNELSRVKRTVAVLSGKGGVGKSLVTSLLATLMQRRGHTVGIMDADITGPSIPRMFGADHARPQGTELGLFPVRTHSDIRVMSINLLLEAADAPVIWRGPLIAGAVKQFWTDVAWGDLDCLFIDMPPGTGDVPLTVFQSIPLDGIVIVTSPQDLVSLIVRKAYNMARAMGIPVLGIMENMSYALCPKCGERINLFGESKAEKVAADMGIPFLGRLPVDPELADLCDRGDIERFYKDYVDEAVALIEKLPARASE